MESSDENVSRVLITGAGGFVGRHLIALLLQQAREDCGNDKLYLYCGLRPERVTDGPGPNSEVAPADVPAQVTVSPVALDVRDLVATAALLQEIRPQSIYHLAARASAADTDREAVFTINVDGTRHLLTAASALNPRPRVLLVSTGYVYGNTDPRRPAGERDPIASLSRFGIYTDSKIQMERVARSYRDIVVIARAFAHTGPGQAPNFAIPAFAFQLARIEAGLAPPVLRVGNLNAKRDILDVRDVVRAYPMIMARGQSGAAYNVCNAKPVTIREVLERLRALCRVPTEVVPDPNRMRPADIACSSGNPELIRDTIGWQPEWDLDTTLSDTLDYWRAEVANSLPA